MPGLPGLHTGHYGAQARAAQLAEKIVLAEASNSDSKSVPMPSHYTPDLFGFASVEDRKVVASFDGGNISSDAGALLLGATD
jgi:hypothetical protein